MAKKYHEMNIMGYLGRPLEKVVDELLNEHKKGNLVSIKFNGVMLYSDTVTMDDAYLKITGKTFTDFKKTLEKGN